MSRTRKKEGTAAKQPNRKEKIRAVRRNVKTKLKLGLYDTLPDVPRKEGENLK